MEILVEKFYKFAKIENSNARAKNIKGNPIIENAKPMPPIRTPLEIIYTWRKMANCCLCAF